MSHLLQAHKRNQTEALMCRFAEEENEHKKLPISRPFSRNEKEDEKAH